LCLFLVFGFFFVCVVAVFGFGVLGFFCGFCCLVSGRCLILV
jgi:hypothetical protein